VRIAGQLILSYLRWFCGLPTLLGKAAVTAAEAVAVAVAEPAVPASIRQTVVETAVFTLSLLFVGATLLHSGRRREQ
jgi:hypothetical protein